MNAQASPQSPVLPIRPEHSAADGAAGFTLRDAGVIQLVMLRARPEQVDIRDRVRNVLGCPLPDALQSSVGPQCVVRWLSPDSWLLSLDADSPGAIVSDLDQQLAGHGAVVDVSGGYAVLELSGPEVRSVLQKCTPYDVHPDAFPSGKVVSTTYAKAGVTLRAVDVEHFELIVRRSFARYVVSWTLNAAEEVGVSVL